MAMLAAAVMPVLQMANDAVDRRLSGADPKRALCRFVDYPPSRGKLGFPRCLFENPFPMNPDFWLKGVDFSCVSPWNDSFGRVRAGTAISRRHIVFANHFPLTKDVRISFVGEDGEVCPCSVDAVKQIGKTDIAIGLLNAELTPNIKPAKLLPPDFARDIGDGVGLPVVTFNQQEKVFLTELTRLDGYVHSAVSTNAVRAAFRERIIVGDSGDPVFLLLGDEPVLLCCLQSGGCGAGPALHQYCPQIQKAMDDLAPGYRLEFADLKAIKNSAQPFAPVRTFGQNGQRCMALPAAVQFML